MNKYATIIIHLNYPKVTSFQGLKNNGIKKTASK